MSEIKIVATEEENSKKLLIDFDEEKIDSNDNRYNVFVKAYFDYQAKTEQSRVEEQKSSNELKKGWISLFQTIVWVVAIFSFLFFSVDKAFDTKGNNANTTKMKPSEPTKQ